MLVAWWQRRHICVWVFFFSLAFGSGGAGGSVGSGRGGGGSCGIVALFCCSNTGCRGC